MDWWNKLPNSVQHALWYYAQGRMATSGMGYSATYPTTNMDGSLQWPADENVQRYLCFAHQTLEQHYRR